MASIYNFQSCYKNDFLMLKIFGVWVNDGKNKSKWYLLYYFLVNIFFVLSFNLSLFINLCRTVNDLKSLATSGYVIATCLMSTVKSFYIFRNRSMFKKLYLALNDGAFQPKSKDQVEMCVRALLLYKKIKTLFLTVGSVAIFAQLTTPLFYKRNHQDLPYAASYPVDVNVHLNRIIVYSHQCISVFYISYINMYGDVLLASFAAFIGLQCDLLCHNLSKEYANLYLLRKCVKHHWKIKSFAKATGALFTQIYFLQFAQSTTALCMTLFLLSLVERNSFEFFSLIAYQSAMLSLLFVPCWFASEATRKSENIPIAAYECAWVDATDNFKKDLLFFLQMSQRPIYLYAINFFHISVDTCVKISRASYSYFAVLNNLNK